MMVLVHAWAATWIFGAALVAPRQPSSVSGANLAAECQFPSVVSFRAGENLCTGTMAHESVMVTAAHCLAGGDPATVHFGETHNPYEHRIDVERCEAYPDFATTDATEDDFGYCVLVDPAKGLAPVPLLTTCELGEIAVGRVAVMVGYGLPDDDGNFGRKRYAFTTMASELRADGSVLVGDVGANGCIGDSGGPALVQLDDGSWRAVGVLSRGPGCGNGADAYRVLADRIAWLEERSGFDLSPCHDGDAWSPNEDCASLDADPRIAGDGWAVFCDGPRITPSPSCEMAASDSSSGEATSSSGETSNDTSSSGGGASPSSDGCGCASDPTRSFGLLAPVFVVLVGGRRTGALR
jgi:trypsin